MLTVNVEVPYGSYRRPYARSYAETYRLPPPSAVYGMLLSLVGETRHAAHRGVRLAFAHRTLPTVSRAVKRQARLKYGRPDKIGHVPEFVEVLNDIQFLLAVDSSGETARPTLEERVAHALAHPGEVERFGCLTLGTSEDLVDVVEVAKGRGGDYYRLVTDPAGNIDLSVWVYRDLTKNSSPRRFRMEEPAPLPRGWPQPEDLVTVRPD